jgi:hypothetical protein
MNRTLTLFVGVLAATMIAPRLLAMLGIERAEGFGLDDVAGAAVVVAVILLVQYLL